jgi:hypothetical protein
MVVKAEEAMNSERQLRFSLFLQVAGAAMFLTAAIARTVLVGLDPVTLFFFIGGIGAGALALWTRNQIRNS